MKDTARQTQLEELLQRLGSDRLLFFPIRHHSPACAWHVQEWIRREKPAAVLIEGPADMTALIPFILHPQTTAPFAVYTTYIDRENRLGEPPAELPALAPRRFAGYYPFCDYSPELVALRTGAEVNATLQFIDLTFPEQVLATQREAPLPQIQPLLAESYLQRSAYLTALAKKTGCRDHDDLWDHLFEANFLTVSTTQFIQNVATYCFLARQDSPPAALEADGTITREQAMAAAIRAMQQQTSGKILVITGGFHTVVLPFLVQAEPSISTTKAQRLKLSAEEAQTVLMRYSFEQLDALNGYAAGMPAPAFYQRCWEHLSIKTPEHPLVSVANQLLVEIGQQTRQQNLLTSLSTADAIAALEQARRLAAFRQHPGPTREDLLDGIRSCFVKGAMDAEGALLMRRVQQILTGDRIGDLPSEVGVPPIVEDFRQLAHRLRLKISTSVTQSLTLEIYRKAAHRNTSRLLHSLQFLDVPFGRRLSGPDFVQGYRLDRVQELWEYRWLPQTESGLIEQSLYGATVEEAAIYRLQQAITDLEAAGQGRSALAAVQMLVSACQMGLHSHCDRLLDLIAANIHEDPDFISLAKALNQLILLWQSREPLEAHHLTQIPALAIVAYQKACYLLPNLAQVPAEAVTGTLDQFCIMRELLSVTDFAPPGTPQPALDPDLFHTGLTQLLSHPQGNPALLGGAAGLLHNAGQLEEQALTEAVIGYLSSAPTVGAGFLRGLLRTCRDIAWNVAGLLAAIDDQLATWNETDFLHALPEFRLAFADLTPRETDKVAAQVANLHGETDLGDLTHRQLTEADLQLGLHLNQLLAESLQQDNLQTWLP